MNFIPKKSFSMNISINDPLSLPPTQDPLLFPAKKPLCVIIGATPLQSEPVEPVEPSLEPSPEPPNQSLLIQETTDLFSQMDASAKKIKDFMFVKIWFQQNLQKAVVEDLPKSSIAMVENRIRELQLKPLPVIIIQIIENIKQIIAEIKK
jgi:hypothetical protein